MKIRLVQTDDIPKLARMRSAEWGTQDYWIERVSSYLNVMKNPQAALSSRVIYVAEVEEEVAGFIAGHLTTRYGCGGELQWINVREHYQGKGVATGLLLKLAGWFSEQGTRRVCVNVEPDNEKGIRFYQRHAAQRLNEHWMIWENIEQVSASA